MKKVAFLVSLFWSTIGLAQDQPYPFPSLSESQKTPSAPTLSEQQIDYPSRVLREELDFDLTPVSEGKFQLDIRTRTKGLVFVKIYDVIGNLLYQEKVRVRGNFRQELDMSEHTTKFFIIEVGNEDFNKTKSIVAT